MHLPNTLILRLIELPSWTTGFSRSQIVKRKLVHWLEEISAQQVYRHWVEKQKEYHHASLLLSTTFEPHQVRRKRCLLSWTQNDLPPEIIEGVQIGRRYVSANSHQLRKIKKFQQKITVHQWSHSVLLTRQSINLGSLADACSHTGQQLLRWKVQSEIIWPSVQNRQQRSVCQYRPL